jgi:hypothetical protein
MLKTWAAFARGVAVSSIQETDGNFLIAGCQSHRKGYWEKDRRQNQLSTRIHGP